MHNTGLPMARPPNRYGAIIEKIFFDRYTPGDAVVGFEREDIETAAKALAISLPKNLGDILYSFRFRIPLPDRILATQPQGREWLITMVGKGKYEFILFSLSRIVPNPDLATVSIPDATPEIIRHYALDDEQALLAIVRYNRLLDIFLGLTTYSLQNHLRTTVAGVGQIEIDELYVGLDRYGGHYIVPVQAKGGTDQISVVQTMQDLDWCAERFADLRARAISVQFMDGNRIAFFELVIEDFAMKVVEERHYRLVSATEPDHRKIRDYR